MYFQDVYSLESHLNNDWPTLLKNLKQREDNLLELLQYNKDIISRRRDQDDELFVNDEINQHQQEVNKINSSNIKMEQEEKQIFEKYDGNLASEEQISKLMGRVGARVLQTCQSSLDRCKSFDKELIDKYYQMKTVLVKMINQKDNIDLEGIMKIVISYSKQKLFEELKKLQKLIVGLQNGEFQNLEEIYTPKPQKETVIEKKKEKSVEKPKALSHSKDKASIKEDIKKQQKLRKQKQKLVTKMVNGLYNVMELSRAQMQEDILSNSRQKSKELYHQIFSRNKFNYEQIIEFQAKQESFHEKVKHFKEMMEKESKRLAQVLIKKPIIKIESGENGSVINLGKSQFQHDDLSQDSPMSEKRITANRYRINTPRGKKQFRELSAMYVSAVQSTQDNFNHFKFDTSNQQTYARSNRNRLPQIPTFKNSIRGSSLDHRIEKMNKRDLSSGSHGDPNNEESSMEFEKPKQKKYLEEKSNIHRARMVLKNIQVGVQGVLRRAQPVMHSRQKKNISPNPMEYTFYVKKTGQKFFEPKHNIIF